MSYTYTHGQVGQALGQSVGTNPVEATSPSLSTEQNKATGTSLLRRRTGLARRGGLFDSGKARVAKLEYGAYGEQALGLGDAPGLQFTGKIWDGAIDMYYFPYRYYSPDSSRWLTRDPLGMVDGPNMYGYVMGNPVKYFDKLGLEITGGLGCLAAVALCAYESGKCAGCIAACAEAGPICIIICASFCTQAAITCAEVLAECQYECPPPPPTRDQCQKQCNDYLRCLMRGGSTWSCRNMISSDCQGKCKPQRW